METGGQTTVELLLLTFFLRGSQSPSHSFSAADVVGTTAPRKVLVDCPVQDLNTMDLLESVTPTDRQLWKMTFTACETMVASTAEMDGKNIIAYMKATRSSDAIDSMTEESRHPT